LIRITIGKFALIAVFILKKKINLTIASFSNEKNHISPYFGAFQSAFCSK
jgi:hypothetical protein